MCEIFKCFTQAATGRVYSGVATALSHRLRVVDYSCKCVYIWDQTTNINDVVFANFTCSLQTCTHFVFQSKRRHSEVSEKISIKYLIKHISHRQQEKKTVHLQHSMAVCTYVHHSTQIRLQRYIKWQKFWMLFSSITRKRSWAQ